MDTDSRFVLTPRSVLGLSIALLGVLLTLDRLGVMHVEHLFRYYWPVPIMVMGGLMIVQATDARDRVRGSIFAFVGLWLFLSMQGLIRIRIWELFWPVMLILIGVSMMLRTGRSHLRHRMRRRFGPDGRFGPGGVLGPNGPLGSHGPLGPKGPLGSHGSMGGGRASSGADAERDDFVGYTDRAKYLSIFAVLSGSRRATSAPAFKGGDITAIMGGAQIDLRLATIAPGEDAVLDITTVMGGVEIFVPAHWEVATPIVPVMGGVQDDRLPIVIQNDANPKAPNGRLVLRGFCFMGGVHIKS